MVMIDVLAGWSQAKKNLRDLGLPGGGGGVNVGVYECFIGC